MCVLALYARYKFVDSYDSFINYAVNRVSKILTGKTKTLEKVVMLC